MGRLKHDVVKTRPPQGPTEGLYFNWSLETETK
jgi:hypothetical protein